MKQQPRSRWKLVALITLLSLALGLMFVWWHSHPRSRYQGRTVEQWLYLLDSNVANQEQHDLARQAILRIGPAAVPDLQIILERRADSPFQKLKTMAMRWRLLKPDPIWLEELQGRAARAAYMLVEDDPQVTIPSLVPSLTYHFTNSGHADSENVRALARAGSPGVAVLTNLLVTGNVRVRDQAAYGLSFVADQLEVTRALLRATEDSDRSVRVTATVAMPYRSPLTNETIAVAMRLLSSPDGYERWAGANMLEGYAALPEVAKALQSATNDSDARVKSAALRGLQPARGVER